MSELDKLMERGSQREDVKARQISRKGCRSALLWTLGISFLLTLIPPHIGVIVFLPTVAAVVFYALRERLG